MEIKSLSQFKRDLKVGDEVITTYHLKPKPFTPGSFINEYQDEVRPKRPVIECNTTGFTLATLNEGEWEGRRVHYKDFKTKDCRFDDGKLIIMGKDIDNPDNNSLIKWLTIEVLD